jgi:hypothetical protein
MEDMEAKLGAILNNPAMMQQIMSLAQQMSPKEDAPPQQEKNNPNNSFSEIDFSILQKLSGLTKQSGIDKNQKNLLSALGPYLTKQRISKLEKAMRAAKMANMATSFLQFNSGR